MSKADKQILNDVKTGIIQPLMKTKNPFTSACQHISLPAKIKYDSKISNSSERSTIRIALISLTRPNGNMHEDTILSEPLGTTNRPLPIKHRLGLHAEACRRNIFVSEHRQAYGYWKLYENAIKNALDNESRLICINELGVPANIRGPLPAFFKGVKKLTEQYSAVIIAGSFHDTRTRYNTGYIFYPGCPAEGEPFHKQVSATQELDEHINIPPKRESIVVKAFKLYISVITCLDLMDYSIISSLVQFGDRVDFLFVPVCSPKIETFEDIARMVSSTLPGGVGLINTFNTGKQSHSRLYLFGQTNPKQPDKSESLGSNGIIDFYDIPVQWFNDRKKALQDTVTQYDWLLKQPRTSPA
jgi:hypothetical protein